MKGGKVVTEKFDKELEKIDEKVKQLTALKKDVQLKREMEVKEHVFKDFEKKKIPIERFLVLTKLSKAELESIIGKAEELSKNKTPGDSDNNNENGGKDEKDEESETIGYVTDRNVLNPVS